MESIPQLTYEIFKIDWVARGDRLVNEDLNTILETTFKHGRPYKHYRR
jgi:hypothetical protein